MRLKDGEGLDILQCISKTNPNKRVIMISSFLDNENISKAKELGAYDYINKNTRLFQVLDQLFEGI